MDKLANKVFCSSCKMVPIKSSSTSEGCAQTTFAIPKHSNRVQNRILRKVFIRIQCCYLKMVAARSGPTDTMLIGVWVCSSI